VPLINPEIQKKTKMLRDYFPCVNFNPFNKSDINNNQYIESLDFLDDYIETINNDLHLDILKMTGEPIFASLFPSSGFQKITNKIRKLNKTLINELIKMKKAGKRKDIYKLFFRNEDENFATKLNMFLDKKDKIVPGVTIKEAFFKRNKNTKNLSCSFIRVIKDNKLKDEFIWDFSCYNILHDVNSIDDAFFRYARKNCTLYLFGADFIKFKENPINWPIINAEKRQTLPEYLSKDKEKCKGLSIQFQSIDVLDFVWKDDKSEKWTELESKEHLLELFKLDKKINVKLKDIYICFCIPLLQVKDFTIMSNKDRFIAFTEFGWDMIKNTLLRVTNSTKGQILPTAYTEGINYILEGIPKGTNEYCPTIFETFIQQAAGQAKNTKKWEIRQAVGEYGPLNRNDCQNIDDYLKEIYKVITFVPIEDQEKFLRIINDSNSSYYDKIKEINRLVRSFESIKNIFQNRYETIRSLYYKAFPLKIDGERTNKDGKVISPEIEDKYYITSEQQLINEERKKIIFRGIKILFAGDIEWIRQIHDEPANVLWSLIMPYKPNSTGRLEGAGPDTPLYRLYLNISIKKRDHTYFQLKIRDISDELERNGLWG